MPAKGWRKRQIVDKKILMKLRMRPDGTWEHVYSDGSIDQEFYQMTPYELANVRNLRDAKLEQYHKINQLAEDLIEMALEYSELREAKSVLKHIMSK